MPGIPVPLFQVNRDVDWPSFSDGDIPQYQAASGKLVGIPLPPGVDISGKVSKTGDTMTGDLTMQGAAGVNFQDGGPTFTSRGRLASGGPLVGLESFNDTPLWFISRVADGAAAVGERHAWDAGVAAPNVGAKIAQWGFFNNAAAFVERAFLDSTGRFTTVGLLANHIGHTLGNESQDAVRIKPSGAASTFYRGLAIYRQSGDTDPFLWSDKEGWLVFNKLAASDTVGLVDFRVAGNTRLKINPYDGGTATRMQFTSAAAIIENLQSNGQMVFTVNGATGAAIWRHSTNDMFKAQSITGGYELLATTGCRMRTTDRDVVIDNATRGVVFKDNQATPHYWRLTISAAGAPVYTDLGTALPA